MKKYAVIPDLHERWDLLNQARRLHQQGYKLIFLADYVDSYEAKGNGIQFLLAVIELIVENQSIALWGNHDVQYIGGSHLRCSGYQESLATVLKITFESNKHLFTNIFVCEETKSIFSHAGLSSNYLAALEENYGLTSLEDVVYLTNQNVKEVFYISAYNDGSDPFDGPLWLRPYLYTQEVFKDYTQYVGHVYNECVRQYKNMLVLDTGKPFLIEK